MALARLPLPCWRPRARPGGGALLHQDARPSRPSSTPPALPSLPSVPPSGPSPPPSRPAPPSRPPQPPAGTCVSSVISPFAGCLGSGLVGSRLSAGALAASPQPGVQPPAPTRRPESFYRGHRCLTWYLHLALQLAIGGATCGRALCPPARDQRLLPALEVSHGKGRRGGPGVGREGEEEGVRGTGWLPRPWDDPALRQPLTSLHRPSPAPLARPGFRGGEGGPAGWGPRVSAFLSRRGTAAVDPPGLKDGAPAASGTR